VSMSRPPVRIAGGPGRVASPYGRDSGERPMRTMAIKPTKPALTERKPLRCRLGAGRSLAALLVMAALNSSCSGYDAHGSDADGGETDAQVVDANAPPPVECEGTWGTQGSCEDGYTCGVLSGGAYPFCIPNAFHGECPKGLVAGGLGANCLAPCTTVDDCAAWSMGVCSPNPFRLDLPGWCAP
jgi:hypothetical protein